MEPVSQKVSIGAGAAGGSTPLSIIIVWVIGLTGVVIPLEVAVAIGALVSTVVGAITGYFVPHSSPVNNQGIQPNV